MKEIYNVVKKIDGNETGAVLDSFDDIKDARAELVRQMSYLDLGSDTRFVADEEERESILDSLNEVSQLDGTDMSSALEKVKDWEVPCLVDMPSATMLSGIYDDRFHYDNFSICIEVESVEDSPFDPGTWYPVLCQDVQGNNKQVEYIPGTNLEGMSFVSGFSSMGDQFREQVLDNTTESDRIAIENGQVWTNRDHTLFAILYGEPA